MRMIASSVDLELTDDSSAQAIAGQHAAYCLFDHELWLAITERAVRLFVQTAGDLRMVIIKFLFPLLPRENNLFRVDDDHAIAIVQMVAERWFVLSAQELSYSRCQATQRLTFGIDEVPGMFDVVKTNGMGRLG